MLAAVPARDARPAHAAILPAHIDALVETFYARVRADARLGPLFEDRLAGRWLPHLAKMKAFWASVLLRSGAYKGQPVATHRSLTDVHSDDYRRWLDLFRATAAEVFPVEAVPVVIGAAERIAESLWLATFGGPATSPPDWMRSGG